MAFGWNGRSLPWARASNGDVTHCPNRLSLASQNPEYLANRRPDAAPRGDHPSRGSEHERARLHVARDRAAGADHGALADGDAANDGGIGTDGGAALHQRGDDLPIIGPQRFAVVRHRSRISIVREAHVRTDERPVLDRYPGGDEGKGLDLDVLPQYDTALDLDKRRDLAAIPDPAAIKIDQLRMRDDDVPTEGDIRSNHGLAPSLSRSA